MQKIISDKARGPKPGMSRKAAYRLGIFPWTYDLQHIWAALADDHGLVEAREMLIQAIDIIAANTTLESAEVSKLIKERCK